MRKKLKKKYCLDGKYDVRVERPKQFVFFKLPETPAETERLKNPDDYLDTSNTQINTLFRLGYEVIKEEMLHNEEVTTQIRPYGYKIECSKAGFHYIEKTVTTHHLIKGMKIPMSMKCYDTVQEEIVSVDYTIKYDEKKFRDIIFYHFNPELKKTRENKDKRTAIDNATFTYLPEDVSEEDVKYGLGLIRNTIALGMSDNSDVIIFDKDVHGKDLKEIEEVERFNKVCIDYFGFDNLIFREVSCEGGFHIAFKLNKKVSFDVKKRILKYLIDTYNFKHNKINKDKIEEIADIECPSFLRVLGSYNYRIVKDNKEDQYALSAFSNNTHNTLKEILKKCDSLQGFDVEPFLIEPVIEIKVSEEEIKKTVAKRKNITKTEQKFIDKEYIPNDYRDNGTYSKNREDSIVNNAKDIYDFISADKTFNNSLMKVIRYVYKRGGSEDSVFDIIRSNGSTSRSLRKMSDESLRRRISSAWKCWSKKFDETKCKSLSSNTPRPDEFIDNASIVPFSIKKLLTDSYLEEVFLKIGRKKKKKITKLQIKELIIQFSGKSLYDASKPRSIRKDNNRIFREGFYFTKRECILLKDSKPEIFKGCDVYNLALDILNKSGLFLNHVSHIYNHHDKSKNKATQWIFSNHEEYYFYNSVDRLSSIIINSIKNNIKELFKKFKLIFNKVIIIKIKKFVSNVYSMFFDFEIYKNNHICLDLCRIDH